MATLAVTTDCNTKCLRGKVKTGDENESERDAWWVVVREKPAHVVRQRWAGHFSQHPTDWLYSCLYTLRTLDGYD